VSRVTDIDIVQRRLEYPLPPDAVYWRIGQCGEKAGKVWATCLAYLDARAVRRRLTEVLGMDGWQTRMERFADAAGGAGFVCTLSCRIADEWVERADTSDDTDIEAVKGGASKALVRAAANFGVGEYLYGLGRAYAQINEVGEHYQPGKGGGPGWRWDAPELPAWAQPRYMDLRDQQSLQRAGLALGWQPADVEDWCRDRYGVPADRLEEWLAEDALHWFADRKRDAAGQEAKP